MVSAYRPPNVNAKEFINDYNKLLLKIQSDNKQDTTCIIGIDHNLAFLKSNSNQPTQDFIKLNLDKHMIPVISRPTRITKSSATLIDNLFISENLIDDYCSSLLLDDLSNHLPCLLTLENVDPDMKGYNLVESRKLDDMKLTNIKQDLKSLNWNEILVEGTCQENYDKLEMTLTNTLDSHAPMTLKRQSKKFKPEPWISLRL